ncbi:hypothetical protein [Halosimplex sp. TS25]
MSRSRSLPIAAVALVALVAFVALLADCLGEIGGDGTTGFGRE